MLVNDDVTMCSLATSCCSTVGLDLVKRTLEETVILPSIKPEVCVCVCVFVHACMHVYVGMCVVCVCVCVHACISVCVGVCVMCVVCVYVYMHA